MSNEKENPHASSVDVSVAPITNLPVSASVNSVNPNPNPTEPVASVPVIADRGITAEDVTALLAALTTSEEIVTRWPAIRPDERKRVKIRELGAADFRSQIGELSGRQPEVMPALAGNDALAVQRAAVEELQMLEERVAAFHQRVKDAVALAAREYQTRLSVAYATLKITSRNRGSDLQAQVKRAGLRYKRKKKGAAATTKPAGAGSVTQPVPPAPTA